MQPVAASQQLQPTTKETLLHGTNDYHKTLDTKQNPPRVKNGYDLPILSQPERQGLQLTGSTQAV
jgi:hypothetical protein